MKNLFKNSLVKLWYFVCVMCLAICVWLATSTKAHAEPATGFVTTPEAYDWLHVIFFHFKEFNKDGSTDRRITFKEFPAKEMCDKHKEDFVLNNVPSDIVIDATVCIPLPKILNVNKISYLKPS